MAQRALSDLYIVNLLLRLISAFLELILLAMLPQIMLWRHCQR